MATNSPTMIAGADEPATLSGLCQPMAKTAMAQEETPLQARFDVASAGTVGGWRCEVQTCRRTITEEGRCCRACVRPVGNMGREGGTAGDRGFEISGFRPQPGGRAVIGPAAAVTDCSLSGAPKSLRVLVPFGLATPFRVRARPDAGAGKVPRGR